MVDSEYNPGNYNSSKFKNKYQINNTKTGNAESSIL